MQYSYDCLGKRKVAKIIKNCKICKQEFFCYPNKSREWCNFTCRNILHGKKKNYKNINCLVCGTSFKPKFKTQIYCKPVCRGKMRIMLLSTTVSEIREFIFERDGFTCQNCNIKGVYKNLNAHHIIPIYKGGKDIVDNIITLCIACHKKAHSVH